MTQRGLKKSGIRQPWLPGPLLVAPQNIPLATKPIVPAPPISAFSGVTHWIGSPRLPEQTRAFAKAVVIVGAMVLTPAQAWMPRPLDGNVPTSRPQAEILVGQQPVPQSNFTRLGMVPRTPDPTRPGQPIELVIGPQPIPQVNALLFRTVRNEPAPTLERLAFTQILAGQQPTPQSVTLWLSSPDDEPSIQWPRLAITVGAQPYPQASVLLFKAIRDEVAPTVDRLAFTQIVTGQQPTPSARLTLLTRPLLEASIQWPRILLSVGQQVYPQASSVLLRAIRDLGADRVRPLLMAVGQQPTPDAAVTWLRSGIDGSIVDLHADTYYRPFGKRTHYQPDARTTHLRPFGKRTHYRPED